MIYKSSFLTTLFFLTILLSTTFKLEAQQTPYFTFLSENRSMVNPAAISPYFIYSKGHYNLNVDVSYQGGVNERSTTRLNTEYISTNKGFKWLGGINLLQDEFGKVEYLNGSVRFGAVISKKPASGAFSVALQLGFEQFGFRWSEVTLLEANDPLPHIDQNATYPTVGIGFFYHKTFENSNWFGGIAVPKANITNEENLEVYSFKDFTAMLGVNYSLTDLLLIEPSLVVFHFGEKLYGSGTVRAYWLAGDSNIISLGGGYATNKTLQLDGELVLGNFRIGGAYVLHTAFSSNSAPNTFRFKGGWMLNTSN